MESGFKPTTFGLSASDQLLCYRLWPVYSGGPSKCHKTTTVVTGNITQSLSIEKRMNLCASLTALSYQNHFIPQGWLDWMAHNCSWVAILQLRTSNEAKWLAENCHVTRGSSQSECDFFAGGDRLSHLAPLGHEGQGEEPASESRFQDLLQFPDPAN